MRDTDDHDGPALSAEALAEGIAWLIARDEGLARAHAETGTPRLRNRPDGFATLLHAIVGQQVSLASAAAIWARVEAAGLDDPDALLAAGAEGLRACGFTRPKQKYALAIAASGFDFAALRDMEDTAAIDALDALPGIGRWTAEIYAMTALGRPDVLPAGDLALQEGARLLYGWDLRPREAALREVAAAWSPWRGVAARLLWDYYVRHKGREIIA